MWSDDKLQIDDLFVHRNLTMQLMPIGTWIISLFVFYCVDPQYGEQWDAYSYMQLVGFVLVLVGSYLYMAVPTKDRSDKQRHKQKRTMTMTEVDLYQTACTPDPVIMQAITPITPM